MAPLVWLNFSSVEKIPFVVIIKRVPMPDGNTVLEMPPYTVVPYNAPSFPTTRAAMGFAPFVPLKDTSVFSVPFVPN